MEDSIRFRRAVHSLLDQWSASGLPSHERLLDQSRELTSIRHRFGAAGFWELPKQLVTVTLDDAIGQGLTVINAFSKAVGIGVLPLGLCQAPEDIIAACQRDKPDFLGVTMLYFDSEAALAEISENLPQSTRLIAGGPVFKADPDLCHRTGVHFAATDVYKFIRYLLTL